MRITWRPSAPAVLAGALFGAGVLVPACASAVCGDNVRDGSEQCDGADVGGATCADLTSGFAQGGAVLCKPDCTYEAADCRRAFLESLIPSGGPRKTRCHHEWGTVGTSTQRRRAKRRVCSEGDRTCDQDRAFNNECLIRVQLCLNVPDPRYGDCAPGRIFRFELLPPTVRSADVVAAVLRAAKTAGGEQSKVEATSVAYSPPVTIFNCGAATVRVPLKGTTGRARPGSVHIRGRTSDNSGRVRSTSDLELVCMP
jgi:hypothetical protein